MLNVIVNGLHLLAQLYDLFCFSLSSSAWSSDSSTLSLDFELVLDSSYNFAIATFKPIGSRFLVL